MTDPAKQAEAGRDPETGRFQPGHSGNPNGRPRGYDFRKIVREHLKKSGKQPEDVIAEVFDSLHGIAMDEESRQAVAAGRELLNRLCDDDPQEVEIKHSGEVKRSDQTAEERIDAVKKAIALIEEARGGKVED